MKLQDFRFNRSQYERPNQKKICGWTKYGKPCQIGPNAKGECQAQFECVPYKDKDRWYCTRPSNAGGKCSQGPSPTGECCNRTPRCVPVSTLRVKRGKYTRLAIVVMLILIFGFLSSSLRDTLFSPGELSSHHNFESIQCSSCHMDSKNSSFGWIANVFGAHNLSENNGKCIACHDMGKNSDLAHSVSLQSLTALVGNDSPTILSPIESVTASCATCHQEHKGLNNSLQSMDNKKCDSCHQQAHDGFQANHSEFNAYPFSRRSGIIFDHKNHISDYFKKDKHKSVAPNSCSSCHAIDNETMTMSVQSFESGCIDCHSKDTTGEKLEEKGFAVIGLPAVDVESLSGANVHIGQWPDSLEDEELAPIMLLLLSSDKSLHSILTKIVSGKLELFDLSNADHQTLLEVQHLVWSIKLLFYELSSKGQQALAVRFESALKHKLTEQQKSDLIANIPVDLLIAIQKSWLPDLQLEISKYNKQQYSRNNLIPSKELPENNTLSKEDWMSSGGWYSQVLNIYYRSSGHGDTFLETLLSLSDYFALNSGLINQNIFKALIDTKLSGQCTKCHSVDVADNKYVINWSLEDSNPPLKLTHFKHQSHFSLMGDSGCKTCHALIGDADVLSTYKQFDPEKFNPGWQQLQKQTCAQCHNESSGIDKCTTCHEYHALPVKTTIPAMSLKELDIE